MNSSEILANEEMSALLPDAEKADALAGERERRRRIIPYNFRRPDRLSKEQVRSLYLLHDLFAHALSSSLPLFLRTVSEVSLISVEQQSYGEYLRAMSDPNVIFTVSLNPLNGVAAFEISPSIAFSVIDRMLGGSGQGQIENRPTTEIEQKILEGFLALVTNSFCEAWRPIIDFETQVVGCETHPQLLQIVAPNEVVIVVSLYVQTGEAKGTMSICLPVILLEPVIEKFARSSYARNRETLPQQTKHLLNALSAVCFPVTIELHQFRAVVSDLLELSKGDIIRTNHRLDEPALINVGGSKKFVGRIAASDNLIVAQITHKTVSSDEPVEAIEEIETTETIQ